MNKLKEIVVLSGKGGTGKTSITASLAWFARNKAIVTDCDVDAANLHLLLSPENKITKEFHSGYEVVVDSDLCVGCGACQEVCRFGAIDLSQGKCVIDPLACEGCGYCTNVCPTSALSLKPARTGWIHHSQTRLDMSLVHAHMEIGAENSGKMVTQLKQEAKQLAAKEGKEILLVDGTPGIGCPVIASLSGADMVVMVTEPTISGLHDMERAFRLVKRFGIPATCIINKATLNSEMTNKIKEYLLKNDISLMGELPYHKAFISSMVSGVTLPEYDDALKEKLKTIWERIEQFSRFPGVRMAR